MVRGGGGGGGSVKLGEYLMKINTIKTESVVKINIVFKHINIRKNTDTNVKLLIHRWWLY